MAEKFNSKRFFNNIEYLIRTHDRKVGEVETEAGVSAGYISRTNKESGSKPGIDFIMNISEVLHVSIDTLLKVDIASLTPTEAYLVSFLEKLTKETSKDLLAWEFKSVDTLNSLEPNENFQEQFPLFSCEMFSYYGGERTEEKVVFISRSFGKNTYINGDCFQLRLKNGAYIYIMDIVSGNESNLSDTAKEIWMSMNDGSTQFLCSDYADSKMKPVIQDLHAAVTENIKHPKVKPEFKYIIDSFMNGDINDDSPTKDTYDEIPF
nr:MAG TPA: Methylphosphonate synthase, Hydroxymethylphosphonate, Iron, OXIDOREDUCTASE [Caudoviricetes sp.]